MISWIWQTDIVIRIIATITTTRRRPLNPHYRRFFLGRGHQWRRFCDTLFRRHFVLNSKITAVL
jgi:hypothetical protein